MNKTNYAQQRLDPRWQRKRLEIMQRDNFTCQFCGCTHDTLNVHHTYYVSGRMPWQYPAWSLKTLCKVCHELEHEIEAGKIETAEENGGAYDSLTRWEPSLAHITNGRHPDSQPMIWQMTAALSVIIKELEDHGDDEPVGTLADIVWGVQKSLAESRRSESSECEYLHIEPYSLKCHSSDQDFWRAFLSEIRLKRPLIAFRFTNAYLYNVGEDSLIISFPYYNKDSIEALLKPKTKEFLEGVAESLLERKVELKVIGDWELDENGGIE